MSDRRELEMEIKKLLDEYFDIKRRIYSFGL